MAKVLDNQIWNDSLPAISSYFQESSDGLGREGNYGESKFYVGI